MKIDVSEYRTRYLNKVEERIMAKKDQVANFSTQGLHAAIMSEMNRADNETWEVEVPDNMEQALKEAEERILENMKKNVDLGVGASW